MTGGSFFVSAAFDPKRPLPLVSCTVTQAVIDAYADATGDHNPIHVDPAYAATGPFGQTIAHGLMTLAFVAQMMNRWTAGAFDEGGELDVAFVAPVFAGDTVEVTGALEEIGLRGGRRVAKVRLACAVGERRILAGHAYQPISETGE